MKSEVSTIFDDLDSYRRFCVQFGRVFNEHALYNQRDNNWRDYLQFKEGNRIRNHWNYDRSQMNKRLNGDNKRHNNRNGPKRNFKTRSRNA